MTLLQALVELDPGRIGEINLLLAALAQGPRDESAAARVMGQMAARCAGYPKPASYLATGLTVGLVDSREGRIHLTRLGDLMLEAASWPPYDVLNENQRALLIPELLGDREIKTALESLLGLMRRLPDGNRTLRTGSLRLGIAEDAVLRLLQAVGLVRFEPPALVMEADAFMELSDMNGVSRGVSEEELWSILEAQRIRGRDAEKFVVEYERHRLHSAGRFDLEQLVDRVSRLDTGAGFDILSFEEDGNERYIEVKSSTRSTTQFYWSSREKSFAQLHGDAYWIYFVPRAQDLPRLRHDLVLIRNPAAWLGDELVEEPTQFLVTLAPRVESLPALTTGLTPARMLV